MEHERDGTKPLDIAKIVLFMEAALVLRHNISVGNEQDVRASIHAFVSAVDRARHDLIIFVGELEARAKGTEN